MGKKEASTTASVDLTKALMHGSAGIKKKIRDITRLLSKDTLPADVKIANERALKTLKLELEKVQTDNKAKKLAAKYHKVRFFERKKAMRFYKKSEKAIKDIEEQIANCKESDGEEIKELKKKLKKEKRVFEHCKVDLAYVLNFPKTEKYIALYATTDMENLPKKAKDGIKRAYAKREELKKRFGEQLRNNSLEISLEDGIRAEIRHNNNTGNVTKNVDDALEDEGDKEVDDFFE